uniref:Uncharacterized protein n=1 Tax=Chromera velia CCMP2878 TaxID=1169474 RepID=A0A0G4G6F5_9ALVE|eukprot:Cvel_20495.t1-p1 / transcript=Cvel_20495.t1 / gene=Cvel_20495 / organism=Chromera_velia_CCMP2878 / gene_product=hypothetical protein / transcript_product=hypothetical protein / location=Cvel_scaffold1843:20960-25320(+) / protein_length=871 / sequence_SO=supercontig / SO=protein_coding / is_pseudo=false
MQLVVGISLAALLLTSERGLSGAFLLHPSRLRYHRKAGPPVPPPSFKLSEISKRHPSPSRVSVLQRTVPPRTVLSSESSPRSHTISPPSPSSAPAPFCSVRNRSKAVSAAASKVRALEAVDVKKSVSIDWRRSPIAKWHPRPRAGATAVALPEDHEYDVLMFGGYMTHAPTVAKGADSFLPGPLGIFGAMPPGEATSCLWGYSILRDEWTRIQDEWGMTGEKFEAEEHRPTPRMMTQSVLIGRKVWIVGGWEPWTERSFNSIWTLDIDTWRWEKLPLRLPWGGTCRFQMAEVGGKIYIHSYKDPLKLLVIDPESETLSEQITKPKSHRRPPPIRQLHSLTKAPVPVRDENGKPTGQIREKLVLFGGIPPGNGMCPEDVWTLDTQTWEWERVKTRYDMPGGCAKLEKVRRAIEEEAEDGQLGLDPGTVDGFFDEDMCRPPVLGRVSHQAVPLRGGRRILIWGGAQKHDCGCHTFLLPSGDEEALVLNTQTSPFTWQRIKLRGATYHPTHDRLPHDDRPPLLSKLHPGPRNAHAMVAVRMKGRHRPASSVSVDGGTEGDVEDLSGFVGGDRGEKKKAGGGEGEGEEEEDDFFSPHGDSNDSELMFLYGGWWRYKLTYQDTWVGRIRYEYDERLQGRGEESEKRTKTKRKEREEAGVVSAQSRGDAEQKPPAPLSEEMEMMQHQKQKSKQQQPVISITTREGFPRYQVPIPDDARATGHEETDSEEDDTDRPGRLSEDPCIGSTAVPWSAGGISKGPPGKKRTTGNSVQQQLHQHSPAHTKTRASLDRDEEGESEEVGGGGREKGHPLLVEEREMQLDREQSGRDRGPGLREEVIALSAASAAEAAKADPSVSGVVDESFFFMRTREREASNIL